MGDICQFNIETMKATVYSWILKVWGQQLTTLKTVLTVDWLKERKNKKKRIINVKSFFEIKKRVANDEFFGIFFVFFKGLLDSF